MFGFAVIGHRINPIKQNSATINADRPPAMKIFLFQVAPKPIQILLLTRGHRLSAGKIFLPKFKFRQTGNNAVSYTHLTLPTKLEV